MCGTKRDVRHMGTDVRHVKGDIVKFQMPFHMHFVVLTNKVNGKYTLILLLPISQQLHTKYIQHVMSPKKRVGGVTQQAAPRVMVRTRPTTNNWQKIRYCLFRHLTRYSPYSVTCRNGYVEWNPHRPEKSTDIPRICEVKLFWFGLGIRGTCKPPEFEAFPSSQTFNECLAGQLFRPTASLC